MTREILVNPFEVKDYIEVAVERSTEQFKDKPVYRKFLELIMAPVNDIQEMYRRLMQERSLDTAYGAQLDLLGNLVGQPRTLLDADLASFFGFRGEITADSFGSFNDPSVGSVYWNGEQSRTGDIVLSDYLYRILIKAKIFKNITRATPEDMMRFCNFVFETVGSTVIDEGGAGFTMAIGKVLTKQEVGLLRWINTTVYYNSTLLPKPVGVKINFANFNGDAVFAFQGVPNAKGFGTLEYSTLFDGSTQYNGYIATRGPVSENGEPIGGYYASFIEI